MLIPMVVAGRTIGVLTMVSAESGRSFDEDDLVFARRPGAPRGDRGRERAPVHRARAGGPHAAGEPAAGTACRPCPDWELASSYAAGDTTAEVGGDFFDVVELEEGFLAVVGDVTGKGVEAAALTALARYTLAHRGALRSQPRRGRQPAQRRPRRIARTSRCSRWCARTSCPSSSGARLRLTSAGHPLPVLARAGHAPTTVGPPGLLLGMTGSARWEETEIELAPGDTLLFYTDGVTDTPSGRERFGEERLLAAIPAAPADPREMIAAVQGALREFQVGDVVDDRAMLGLQVVGVGTARSDGDGAGSHEPRVSVS